MIKRILIIILLTNISFAQSNKSKIISELEESLNIQNTHYADKDIISNNLKSLISINDSIKSINGSKYILYNKYKPDSLYFVFKENKLVGCKWYFTNKNSESKSLQKLLEKNYGSSGVSMKNKITEYYWEDSFSKLGLITKDNTPNYLELNFKFYPEKKIIDEQIPNYRKGNGNGKFAPDLNSALIILQKASSKKNLEDLLPEFKVSDNIETTFQFNEITNEHDLLYEEVSKYTFMYKNEYIVFLKVYTKKNIITKLEYSFDVKENLNQLLDLLKEQTIKNGFILDMKLSKVISKLGFNNCIVFTKKPNYNLTMYTDRKYSISK